MLYWLYFKIKEIILKKQLIRNNSHVEIGNGIQCTAPETISISDYVYVGPNCKMYGRGGIRIGFNTIIGNDVTILTTNHNYDCNYLPYSEEGINKKVYIGENVWIASNVFILPGVTIGDGSVVAGGSVVTKDVLPCSVVGGNPAKTIKMRDEEKYNNAIKQKNFYLVKKYSERKWLSKVKQ